MKGKIQHYSIENQSGLIIGSDQNHYEFQHAAWRSPNSPKIGDDVDFVADAEGKATAIYLSAGQPNGSATYQTASTQNETQADESGFGMIDWFVKCISSHYFTFSGRSRRKEFWYFMLFCLIIGIFTALLDAALNNQWISTIVNLALFIPSLAVGARRLHDVGRSGWWQLIAFTVIGILLLIFWWVQDSHKGSNQHGPSPK